MKSTGEERNAVQQGKEARELIFFGCTAGGKAPLKCISCVVLLALSVGTSYNNLKIYITYLFRNEYCFSSRCI